MLKTTKTPKATIIASLLVLIVILAVSWSPMSKLLPTTSVVTETRTVTVGAVTVTVQALGSSEGPDYQVYFSPNGGCQATLLNWIHKANQSIHVMIFSVTLNSVGDALVAAHRRGIDVRMVMDKNEINAAGSENGKLKAAGVSARLHTTKGIMHNKVAIIDGEVVITGSFNWTNDGENSNNENMIVIRNKGVASVYETEFQRLWNRSAP
jgi:phosphatidylserine/phosphatidylglycerophosphate/cardiolipin synthase-like enzyme